MMRSVRVKLSSSFGNLLRRIQRLLSSQSGTRLSREMARLLVGAPLLSLVLVASYAQAPGASPTLVLSAIAGLFLLPLLLLLAEYVATAASQPRRHLGTLLDIGAITGVLLLGGAVASPLWLAYLWVIADNARRFGSRGLYLSVILSLTGFSLVLFSNSYWLENSRLGLSLLCLLAALAPYLSRTLCHSAPPRRDAAPPEANSAAIDLPVGEADNASRNRLPNQPAQGLSGKKILLLSNDSGEQQTIKRHLDSWGAVTRVYSNVARSFAALISACEQDESFHALIVLNGQFDMDARQLAVCIRTEPALQGLLLIHVGATPEGPLSDQLRTAGYARLLTKPLDKTLLFDALHSAESGPPDELRRVVKLLDRYSGRKSRQPLSILLADSNQNDLRRSKQILQHAGHRVFIVEDGLRILDALDSHCFDIAVVSVQLPEVSGLEAFKLYRFTRSEQPWMPFVILLDPAAPAQAQECKDAGVNAILAKPLLSTRLIETVEHTVQACVQNKLATGSGSFDAGSKLTRAIVIDGLTLDGQRLVELEQLGKGETFLADLVANFNQESRQILQHMEQSVEQTDVRRFRDLGHTIKDSAGSLGIFELYQLGVRATRLYSSDFPDSAMRLLKDLRQCCDDSHRALRHYLSSRGKFFGLHE